MFLIDVIVGKKAYLIIWSKAALVMQYISALALDLIKMKFYGILS